MEKRNYGIDFLRILSMLGIVTLHFLNLGGILNELIPLTANAFLLRYIYIINFTSVNVFGIITGYLSINKKEFKWNRIIELVVSTAFWSCCITIVLTLGNHNYLNGWEDILISLFPPINNRYWYIVSYVFVYFMMPYMNGFIDVLEQKKFKSFIIILLIILSIIPTFGNTDFFRTNTGSSPWWLIVCYFIGAYIKKYSFEFANKNRKWIICFCAISIFVWTWWNIIEMITISLLGTARGYSMWHNAYYSPLIVIMSALLVIIFSNLQLNLSKKNKKTIKMFSGCMFGVYIIHAHPALWDKVICPFIASHASEIVMASIWMCIIYVFGGIGIIVIAASILEYLRIKVFIFLKIDYIISEFSKKLDKIFAL